MRTKIFILAATLALLSFKGFSQTVSDQSFKDLTFVRFKVELLRAILDRDTCLLFPLLAQQVHVSEDGCNYAMKECFMEEFRQGGAEADELWDDMLKVVSFGFSQITVKDDIYRLASRGDIIFQAPSYRKSFDDKKNQYLLVLGQNVNIRERPTTSSKVVAQATYETLRYTDPMVTGLKSDFHFVDGKQWYQVTLSDGRTGYIMEEFVSAGIDRELSVKKINDEWKVISFFSTTPKY